MNINFEAVENVISDKHVKLFVIYEYVPQEVQSPLTNIIVYDLEPYIKDRTVACCSCIYILRKISGKHDRDSTEENIKNVQMVVLFLKKMIVLMTI